MCRTCAMFRPWDRPKLPASPRGGGRKFEQIGAAPRQRGLRIIPARNGVNEIRAKARSQKEIG